MTTGYRPEIIQRAFVDFIGSRLHPFWSLTTPKLRLIARQTINEELVALKFEANQAFKRQAFTIDDSWHGGKHIHLTVPIEGINHQRSYSLVGMFPQPADFHDAIFDNNAKNAVNDSASNNLCATVTIAIKPQGLVSDYLTQQASLGTVFDSSLPSGDFTLADTSAKLTKQNSEVSRSKQSPLLFIAGSSGITPMLGLITQALSNGHQVTLLHYSQTVSSKLQHQWQQLNEAYPYFTYHLIHTEEPTTYLAGTRYLSAEGLLSLSLPLVDTQIFACGSQALLAGLYKAAAEITLSTNKQLRDNIIVENFGNSLADVDNGSNQIFDKTIPVEEHTVYLRSRQRQFSSDTTILAAAENADVRLAHGCRQGICQLCRCNKVSGVVKNVQTGKVSGDGYESIQTCINIAMTDVILDI